MPRTDVRSTYLIPPCPATNDWERYSGDVPISPYTTPMVTMHIPREILSGDACTLFHQRPSGVRALTVFMRADLRASSLARSVSSRSSCEIASSETSEPLMISSSGIMDPVSSRTAATSAGFASFEAGEIFFWGVLLRGAAFTAFARSVSCTRCWRPLSLPCPLWISGLGSGPVPAGSSCPVLPSFRPIPCPASRFRPVPLLWPSLSWGLALWLVLLFWSAPGPSPASCLRPDACLWPSVLPPPPFPFSAAIRLTRLLSCCAM